MCLIKARIFILKCRIDILRSEIVSTYKQIDLSKYPPGQEPEKFKAWISELEKKRVKLEERMKKLIQKQSVNPPPCLS